MAEWRFWAYLSPAGRDPIRDWRKKDLEKQQCTDMDALIRIWRKQAQWDSRDFKPLGTGLSEFRFKSCKTQLRLVGFYWPAKNPADLTINGNYTFLIGCSHKQQIYEPPSALATAAERMELLKRGLASQHVYT
jgi:hypothetical protein